MRAWTAALGTGLALAATSAPAVPSEEQIARLGADLTPVGAERAGNTEGTIPAWTGGVTEPPAGWEPGQPRVDPFEDDPVLFSIDASNVDEYADKLSEGQIALIQSFEGYRMDIYPTRRSCALSDWMYEDIKLNLGVARVDELGFLQAGVRSPLFPLPENGIEAAWNGKLATYNGIIGTKRPTTAIVPTQNGAFIPVRRDQTFYYRVNDPNVRSFEELDGVLTKWLARTYSPPRQAGEIALVHSLADGHLEVWTYNPGQRRVRRAPNFEYDNPTPGWQGLVTIDQQNGFVGSMDRYEWKLLGKQELYIPYNNTKIHDRKLKYKAILESHYPKRELVRYELHRVWKVEATLRPGKRHVMPKRVFYMDEDTWLFVVADGYDRRGTLWRVSEHLPQLLYEVPTCAGTAHVYYDLVARRYVVNELRNEEAEETDWLAGHTGEVRDEGFSPDALRRMGKR